MTEAEILEAVMARTGNLRFRTKLDRSSPEYDPSWWTTARQLLDLPEPPKPEPAPAPAVVSYPPLAQQARNLAGSLKRWWKSGLAVSTAAEARRRRDICQGTETTPQCELYDPARRRCTKCGCKTALKPWLATEVCPLKKW